MEQTTVEYRVVVDRAGINSVDYYFNVNRASDRMEKLQGNPKNKVCIQAREVTEWKVIAGESPGKV